MNKFGLAVFTMLVYGFFFGPAQAQSLYKTLGDWEITSARDSQGTFEVCAATRVYANGEAVVLYANPEHVTIGLLLERWVLDNREVYDIALQFEDFPRHPGQAHKGEDGKSVLINLDFTPALDQISASQNLYLHTSAGSLRFDVSGAAEALEAALSCRAENQSGPAQ